MSSNGAFQPVESQSLMVGHVVKVECDREFPADVVLLQVCCQPSNPVSASQFSACFMFRLMPRLSVAIRTDAATFRPQTCTLQPHLQHYPATFSNPVFSRANASQSLTRFTWTVNAT